MGLHDVPGVARALHELGPTSELEQRLTSTRPAEQRVGALKALFFRDPVLRAHALAAARVDPAPRVRAVGRHLEELLQEWLADPEGPRCLGPVPPNTAPTGTPSTATTRPVPEPSSDPALRSLAAVFAEPVVRVFEPVMEENAASTAPPFAGATPQIAVPAPELDPAITLTPSSPASPKARRKAPTRRAPAPPRPATTGRTPATPQAPEPARSTAPPRPATKPRSPATPRRPRKRTSDSGSDAT
jgi:hypothetical protein